MLVGKTGHGPSCKQEEINALMVTLAKAGKRVVRLKGGDPLIFGRATEEIAACRAAGIPVEVVPGISAAQGAASRLGISLTHRRRARRVQYVTGHGADGRLPGDIDWESLADPGATTVVYMPSKTLTAFGRDRHRAGPRVAATPAAAVFNATRPPTRPWVGAPDRRPAGPARRRRPRRPRHRADRPRARRLDCGGIRRRGPQREAARSGLAAYPGHCNHGKIEFCD